MPRLKRIEFTETTPENAHEPLIQVSTEAQQRFATLLSQIDPARDYLDLRTIDFSGVRFKRPRGKAVATPHGTLPEIISEYLLQLSALTGGDRGPIGTQFIARPEEEAQFFGHMSTDALNERLHEHAHRVVEKYVGRVLFILTSSCASICRDCTRVDLVGKDIPLSLQEIQEALDYISQDKKIKEIIFSGGDPLNAPLSRLEAAMRGVVKLQESGQIDIVRIGTRLPIHDPRLLLENPERLERLIEILKPIENLNIMLHIDHPLELTRETKELLDMIRKGTGAQFYSQTVLWKGVNDNRETLLQLFRKIKKTGIVPYYLFQNDEAPQAVKSTVSIHDGRQLVRQIRSELSGLEATFRYVIDVKDGHGKIPVEEGYWIDDNTFEDYHGDVFRVNPDGMGTTLISRSGKSLVELPADLR